MTENNVKALCHNSVLCHKRTNLGQENLADYPSKTVAMLYCVNT